MEMKPLDIVLLVFYFYVLGILIGLNCRLY